MRLCEHILTHELLGLHDAFRKRAFDLRLVGGVVRDLLTGHPINDIDLATDATPAEQQQIYVDHAIQHAATGLKHGTWMAVLDRPYEITTLRTETAHDGRHATVTWTRDWHADLSRRDFTINAMACSFDGELFDPFGGSSDALAKKLCFVGDPAQRMHEDYLRILRLFRFCAKGYRYDASILPIVQTCMTGLRGISRERVWSEIGKILAENDGAAVIQDLVQCGVGQPIDLPSGRFDSLRDAHQYTREPASLLAAYLGRAVETVARRWKWSTADRSQAMFIVDQPTLSLDTARHKAATGCPKHWLVETFCVQGRGDLAEQMRQTAVPVCPVLGRDLIMRGIKSGPELGDRLRHLQQLWDQSDFTLTRDQLLAQL